MHTLANPSFWRSLPRLVALFFLTLASAAFAQQEAAADADADPPARVANLSFRQGGVVFAPEGEEEWVDLPQNRPLTVGDRLWSDRDARAELHLGSATLHIDGESHLGIGALDERAAQFILMQGTLNARVRELAQGENFEIDTPNLAFRATQPGDYRIDVDADGRETRIVVQSGMATVFGESGESVHLGAGQQATFAGRFLARVDGTPYRGDAFSQWAGERNRAEDLSVAARHVPRGVVGYSQLDQHGTWSEEPNYGTVWYPQVEVADWAPYRYGRWEWIQPWGWTWVDDAPWGFAPFHYGRWAQIGPRWAWVPGRMAARPVYSPALVVFLGGGNGVDLSLSSGPGIGWYPLAPGEAWWPTYRTSPRYLNYANFHIDLNRYPRHFGNHFHRHRPHAVTAVRVDDFRGGRSLRHAWRPLNASAIAHARIGTVPGRPDRGARGDRSYAMPRLQALPPRFGQQQAVPSRFWGPGREGWERARGQRDGRFEARRDDRGERFESRRDERGERIGRGDGRDAQQVRPVQQAPWTAREQAGRAQPGERDRAVREQQRAQQEQSRLQRDAERNARQQQRTQQAERMRQDQAVRQQQQIESVRAQQREAHRQQQDAVRQQRRAQQEGAQRQQFEAARQHQWRAQQEQAQRHQERAQRGAWQPQPQVAAPIGGRHGGERFDRGDRGGRNEGGRGQHRGGGHDGPGRGRGNG